MFLRNVLHQMESWAASPQRKPLILRGARQVGKTTAVDLFARDFDQYLYLNLEHREDADLFSRQRPIGELIQAIFFTRNVPLSSGRVLLFIDEIQHAPGAVAAMRDFYESAPHLHVIGAGSLLEAMIGTRQISFPVGRVQYLFMYPLTFDEFLQATGQEQARASYHQVPLPDFAADKLHRLFHQYALIGGMPEIVQTYADTGDLVSLSPLYQGLITAYLDDVSKYARNATLVEVIRHAIETAPFEAGKRIRFQGFGNSNYRSREMGEALRVLERAMLLYLLYPSTATRPPAMPDKKKLPRLQFLDTGLLNYAVGLQEYFFKHEDLQAFYRGLLAEHIVGQELLASDMRTGAKPVFWVREKKQSNAEVDFLLPRQRRLIPVEVKAGKTGTLRSLHQFMDRADHEYAVRLYAGAMEKTRVRTTQGREYTLLSLPYFLAGKLDAYVDWLVAE